jgi:hypothetical protein
MLCNEFLNLKGGFKKLEPPLFSRISSQPFFPDLPETDTGQGPAMASGALSLISLVNFPSEFP